MFKAASPPSLAKCDPHCEISGVMSSLHNHIHTEQRQDPPLSHKKDKFSGVINILYDFFTTMSRSGKHPPLF